MKILTNQNLEVKNLLTVRFRDVQENIDKHLSELVIYAKKHNLIRTGMPISTTYEIDTKTGDMDMEFYFPINKPISNKGNLIYKEKLCLYNCLVIKHRGNPENIQNSYDILNNYILENSLMPISSGFNVTIKEVLNIEDVENYESDIYISINPNIT